MIRELGSFFGYISMDCSSPSLPSESESGGSRSASVAGSASVLSGSSSRSSSPRPTTAPLDDRRKYVRRTAAAGGASDSSGMAAAMFRPPTPEVEEVVEELCVEERSEGGQLLATPFFSQDNGVTLIKGGTVVNYDSAEVADVLVQDGKVVAVGEDLQMPEGATLVDAVGKYVVPGGIDTSTHFHRAQGGEKVELADDWSSGTRAAVAGGTTMVVDLVLPERGDGLVEAFNSWREAAEEATCCDFALAVAVPQVDQQTRAEMQQLAKELGVNTFKLFMSQKNSLMLNNAELMEAFKVIKELGGVAKVAAENGDIVAENQRRLLARGVAGPEGHPAAQPQEVEEEAVRRACSLALQANLPLVVCSPSCTEVADIIEQFSSRGLVVLGEAQAAALAVEGSHYYSKCWGHAAAFVTSPPLREGEEVPEGLVAAMVGGAGVDLVASTHTGISMEARARGRDNFAAIPQGLTGVEERMGLVWEKGVEEGKMEVTRFVEVTSTAAAKMLNIYPRKGAIAQGSDADLVVWNPSNLRTVAQKTSHHQADFNVLEGQVLRGAPEFVLQGGRIVVAEYQVSTSPGSGQYVECPTFPPSLYDRVMDRDRAAAPSPVSRTDVPSGPAPVDVVDSGFGLTTPRGYSGAKEVFNKRLGIYQRPMSAHGVRNQQDSTFSLTGTGRPRPEAAQEEVSEPAMVEEAAPMMERPHTAGPAYGRRAAVRVSAPPGGKSGAFW